MQNRDIEERFVRVEGNSERVLYEVADLKDHVRHSEAEIRAEMREHRAAHRAEIVDSRQESREQIKELRRDMRLLLGAQLTSTLGLVAVVAKGFGWV